MSHAKGFRSFKNILEDVQRFVSASLPTERGSASTFKSMDFFTFFGNPAASQAVFEIKPFKPRVGNLGEKESIVSCNFWPPRWQKFWKRFASRWKSRQFLAPKMAKLENCLPKNSTQNWPAPSSKRRIY